MKAKEILEKHFNPFFMKGALAKQAEEAMKEAARQALELAAERCYEESKYEAEKIILDVMEEIE